MYCAFWLYIMIFFNLLYYMYGVICMSKYIHGRTCVYNINYHIVWCVKYRRKV